MTLLCALVGAVSPLFMVSLATSRLIAERAIDKEEKKEKAFSS